MSQKKILLRTKRDPSDQLIIDGLLQENLELRDRVADLEASNDVLVQLTSRLMVALVRVISTRQPDMKHIEQERRQRLLDELRDLRAMVVAESFDDAAAVINSYNNTPSTDSTEATIQ